MSATIQEKLFERDYFGNRRSLTYKKGHVDFASNDYLGLSRSPVLYEQILKEWEKLERAVSSTGSRLLTGNTLYAETLEEEIACFHGCEASLLFGCGYLANLSLLPAITKKEDTLLIDMDSHASVWDGAALSSAKTVPFRHNDLEYLEKKLKQSSRGNRFVCVSSVYSTDGSQAPLKELFALVSRYEGQLIVDEAHAIGIFGKEGRGLVEQEGLSGKVFALVVTFGKALGCYGAAVLGSSLLKSVLMNFGHGAVYSTFLPPMVLAAIRSSYALFPKLEENRAHLKELIDLGKDLLDSPSASPIQSIIIPGNGEVKKASWRLEQRGFDVRPLLSPTVKKGKERLRLVLHAYNSKEELSQCLALL